MNKGEFLSDKRIEKGISAAELAQKLKVSEAEIELWESGKLPDSEYLLALSAVLGVSVEDILNGGDVKGKTENGETERAAAQENRSETGESSESSIFGGVRKQGSDERLVPRKIVAQESYYEKLHKKIRYSDDPASADYCTGGESYNGFSDGERKFGYIVCAVVTVLLIISLAFYLVPRYGDISVINENNYNKYMDIQVRLTGADEYSLRVTAKTRLKNLDVAAELTFDSLFGEEDYTCMVMVTAAYLDEGETASTAFFMERPNYSTLPRIVVCSVKGGLG